MICGVILAAGQSKRMGTQKLLLPYNGTTILAHIIAQLIASPVEEVRVVVSDAVVAQAAGDCVSTIINPDPEGDMLSSVRCGIRELPDDCDGILVALGDQPSITPELIAHLIQAFAHHPIIVPTYQGKRGHPLLFAKSFADEVLTQFDDVGLRGLLAAHAEEVFELPAACPAILHDIDDPADYQRELRRLNQGHKT
jgi:molybdenum cofactor cytidylyltransferase